jgi:predicted RNA-binding protein
VNLVDNKEVVIEFDTDQILENVLILIVDGEGNTLFLDNQKNFKGIYKCSVDMSMYTKGNYFVNIKSEGEQKQAKLTIR